VALLENTTGTATGPSAAPTGTAWHVIASAGNRPSVTPEAADQIVPAGRAALTVTGGNLNGQDLRVLAAVGVQIETVLEQQRLADQAAAARPALEADRVRTALLAAVSHDLRTPLAGAKAAVGTLRQRDIDLSRVDRIDLLDAAEACLDRLTILVTDLLDMSRLQAGALAVFPRRIALDELVPPVLDHLGISRGGVLLDVPDSLPEVTTDAAILERILANLITNALRHSPPGRPPLVSGSLLDTPATGRRVELRVIDHGPGIPAADRDRAFVPFQRLGDHDNTTGVGLGLAVARGLAEALGGTLEPEDTPGGGLTMVVSLPVGVERPDPEGEAVTGADDADTLSEGPGRTGRAAP
jgi:two-component system sensor histidine kinase KdpD